MCLEVTICEEINCISKSVKVQSVIYKMIFGKSGGFIVTVHPTKLYICLSNATSFLSITKIWNSTLGFLKKVVEEHVYFHLRMA